MKPKRTLPLDKWVAKVLSHKLLTCMGHGQKPPDDLGLGWLYYSLARVYKPKTAVVIGSYRGFVPLMIGRALQDNGAGEVVFIDPSFVDSFWEQPNLVATYFLKFGLSNIQHFCLMTQDFIWSKDCRSLTNVGMLFIDGYHSHEQARFDFEAFKDKLTPRSITLFHDSIIHQTSVVYGKHQPYTHRVVDYMKELKKDLTLQVFDVPAGSGVTLVRKRATPEKLFDEKRKIMFIKKRKKV